MEEQITQIKIAPYSNLAKETNCWFGVSIGTYLIVISVFLLLLSIGFQWLIPYDVGIVGGMYVIWYSFVVGAMGTVVSGVIIWRKKTFRTLKNVALVVTSLVLIPVVMGPIMAELLLTWLFLFYDSQYFRLQYLNRVNITVEAQGQRFDYAYCTLEKYTATYRITSQKNNEVIFALTDAHGVSYLQAGDLPFESISKQLEFTEKTFIKRGLVKTLGVFKIPKGTHTVEVNSKTPFLLAIYYPKPLLTPQLFLLNEKDYPKLYTDTFTQKDIELATDDVRGASCQGTQINQTTDYFLNQSVYIPNTKINLYKGNDEELYLYNQWPGNSGPDESLLFTLSHTPITTFLSAQGREFYRSVVNKYSHQDIDVYVTIVKKDDPHRPPYVLVTAYEDFVKQIRDKQVLTGHDLQYLHRTDSYFSVDPAIQFNNTYLNFNDRISPYNIQKVMEIIETIEPGKIYSKEVNL